LLLAAVGLTHAQSSSDAAIEKLFADYYEDYLRWNPEIATSVGRAEYNDRWSDCSREARSVRLAAEKKYLAELDGYDASKLSEQNELSRKLMRYQLTQAIETEPLQPMLRFGQLFRFHNRAFSTMEQMPARTVKDYENIIARLNALPAYVDQNISYEQEAIAQGSTQPRNVVDLVLGQVKSQAAMSAKDTPLLAAFRKMPDSLSEAEREQLQRKAQSVYETRTQPAWTKLYEWIAGTYAPKARPTTSIQGIPDGAGWYEKLVRFSTTTDLTPKEINQIGKAELERIEGEMTKVARSTGYTGDLASYEKKLRSDPANLFTSQCLLPTILWYTRLQKWLKMQPRAFLFRTIRRRSGRFDRRYANHLCKG